MEGYLFTSDWHLRSTTPKSRKDDFQKAMWGKVDQIFDYADEHDLRIVSAGDMWEVAKPAYSLLNRFLDAKGVYPLWGTAGQHDTGSSEGDGYTFNSGYWPGNFGCEVNLTDLLVIAEAWLDEQDYSAGDIDGGGVVDGCPVGRPGHDRDVEHHCDT